MGVSENRGTPKSSILIGISIINHQFWGTTIFGSTHIPTIHFQVLLLLDSGKFMYNIQTQKKRDFLPYQLSTSAGF